MIIRIFIVLTMNVLIFNKDSVKLFELKLYFETYSYTVTAIQELKLIKKILTKYNINFLIIYTCPDTNQSVEICKNIRRYSDIPLIFITPEESDLEKIISLEVGADDFLSTHVSNRELLARLKSVSRRYYNHHLNKPGKEIYPRYKFLHWIVDTAERSLKDSLGHEVYISTGLYNLLLVFLENVNIILSRDRLIDLTKSESSFSLYRSIDVQVGRLRKILQLDKESNIIKTVRSVGYVFTVSANII
ncbi:winged helix-turn-helix domain-containing protein [Francisella sp. SYW-9]|uniref:winged helix-turn-helix domain-containing protein n=1 Tax=Francisella sp. SYW-9 TaxID=2610888 RepID=UPI00123CF5F5|nr:winged helix-turn-helix domain-containing protein [Francisella sp. SYW-9]